MPSTISELWCHSTNKAALIDEVLAAGLTKWLRKTSTGYELGGDRTRIIEKDGELIAGLAVRDPGLLAGLQHIRAIGYFVGSDFVPLVPDGLATFNRIYDRTPVTVTLPDGSQRIFTPPVKPGTMAIHAPSSAFNFPGL